MHKNKLWLAVLLAALTVGSLTGCTVSSSSSSRTCTVAGESCTSSAQCCGPGLCTSAGLCDSTSYLSAGSSCSRSIECSGSLFCTSGICQ